MTRRHSLAVFALLAVGRTAVGGETPPERLLFAGTQVYARWDGVAAHRDAYSQTVVGKLLTDDLAPLAKSLLEQFPHALQSGFVDSKLLSGVAPDALAALQADVVESGKLLDVLIRHGAVFGLEIAPLPNLLQLAMGAAQKALKKEPGDFASRMLPPISATLIIPGAAKVSTPLTSLIRLYARASDFEVTEQVVAGRTVLLVKPDEFRLLAWCEGDHFMAVLTNDAPEAIMARLDGPSPRLDSAPLFQRVGRLTPLPTDFRAFADVQSLVRIGGAALALVDPGGGAMLTTSGLTGVQHVAYVTAFDGPVRREVVELATTGERRGLLRVLGREPLRWDEMPPLPPDADKWSAHRVDLRAAYDTFLALIDATSPKDDGLAKDSAAEAFDKLLGVSVKSELIDLFGSLFVTYHSPAEGGLMLGQVVVIPVKDGERVRQALDQIVQGQIVGNNMRFKRRPFLDAEIRELTLGRDNGRGIVTPSYVVYKSWLVVSLYPQPVQGFVQRAAGKSPHWQTAERVALVPSEKNCTSWAYNDPRAGAQQILSFGPIVIAAAQMGSEEPTIEVGTIPSGSVLMQRLRPNVTTMTDDGTTIRWETRGGLLLLGDAIGLDPLMLVLAAQIFN
jgi:hypothetical protein